MHNDVREDIQDADAKLVSATINRDVIVPMILLNRGPRDKYPRIRIGRPDERDAAVDIGNAEKLTRMGVAIGGTQMRERAGLPAPETGEEPLRVPSNETPAQTGEDAPGILPKSSATQLLDPLKTAQRGKNPEGKATASTDLPAREPDGIDDAVDEALDDWEALVQPMREPIDALLARAETLDDVRDGLIDALQAMDSGAMQSMLARAGFGSRLLGQIEAQGTEDDG